MPADAQRKGSPTLLGKVVSRFSLSGWWHVIKTLNAIANARGENGVYLTKADGGWVFSLTKSNGGETSVGMFWDGEFDQLNIDDYKPGAVTRVSPDNDAASTVGGPTVPGIYLCVEQPGADDYPRHPLQDGGEVPQWVLISTYPSEDEKCVEGTPTAFLSDSQQKPTEPD